MMKKTTRIISLLLLILIVFCCGCGKNEASKETVKEETPQSIDETEETSKESPKEEVPQTIDKIIEENNTVPVAFTYKGKKYGYRSGVSSVLIMGIDRHGEVEVSDSHIGTGQCDAIYLLVIDDEKKNCSVLQLDRDAMVEMETMDSTGTVFGVAYQQLAYAHAYGDGAELSCRHAVKTVSDYLAGTNIDEYAALQFEALPVLNDDIGGVCVEIEDDMTAVDPLLGKGSSVLLKGELALKYVQTRLGVSEGLNQARMRRQRAYLHAFKEQFILKFKENSKIIDSMFKDVSPYMCTSMSLGKITNVASKLTEYEFSGFIELDGTRSIVNKNGKELMEFISDEDCIYETVISLFCKEVN